MKMADSPKAKASITWVVIILLVISRTSVANAEPKYDIQLPEGWMIQRELFGLDNVLLGPFVNNSRPAMSITYIAASIKSEQLERLRSKGEELVKEKRRYVTERKGTFVSTELPRTLRHPKKYEVLIANFVYELESTGISETLYLVNCPYGLYHLKAISRVSLRLNQDRAAFAKIVDSFVCKNTDDGGPTPSKM